MPLTPRKSPTHIYQNCPSPSLTCSTGEIQSTLQNFSWNNSISLTPGYTKNGKLFLKKGHGQVLGPKLKRYVSDMGLGFLSFFIIMLIKATSLVLSNPVEVAIQRLQWGSEIEKNEKERGWREKKEMKCLVLVWSSKATQKVGRAGLN